MVEGLPQGLQTQLGGAWSEGVEPSFGQWQKLALARGFMREEPLLLVLDEPTAALDAETEHALFERFAAQSRAVTRRGRISVTLGGESRAAASRCILRRGARREGARSRTYG
jgi:ATP-binding cassette subfamily B protein